ncbi:MAG: hypothetical protein ACOZIN_18065 [Myxococcota bacterium]
MRTTIVIDDAVLRLARRRAAELKTTVSGLIERALRAELTGRPKEQPAHRPFRLIVNDGPGLLPGYSWDTVARRVLESDRNGLP